LKIYPRKRLVNIVVGLVALSTVWGGAASAEPAQDTVAKINELSKQSDQLAQSIQAAKSDLDTKMQVVADADRRHGESLAALNSAHAQLGGYQGAVDRFAATVYMGGRTDGAYAILTAPSPKILIDKMVTQRVMATEMSHQLQGLRQASQEAQRVEAASAESAASAKAALDAAVALRSDLQNKQTELRKQIAAINADYALLPQAQRAAVPAAVVSALGLVPPIPTVGMGGLVPNARTLAGYIMATYPGVRSIGGVRSDPLPDHPSGRAIDIMIGSDMGLGDAIAADLQRQAGRFGISYTLWRVAAHFDHIHVTVS
jgi:hypothetical protein